MVVQGDNHTVYFRSKIGQEFMVAAPSSRANTKPTTMEVNKKRKLALTARDLWHNWRPFNMSTSVNSNEACNFFYDDPLLLRIKTRPLRKLQVARTIPPTLLWDKWPGSFSICRLS
ncbi:hypothetical protein L6164_006508 [Bauhinia variegata]|uniref:Uncharacterized protein n=1 Tax=Bauhinia variegata TaxID=167791 RepID=A0ACB9PUQ5_BAUVA|nr:hypothetical protein L6164_006508 [Bauhinia variegata]